MPRPSRIKSYDSIYHVMVKGVDDIPLFRDDDDKDKYLSCIKKYQKEFGFCVYAYCLMTNYGHFIIDPRGSDITKAMHGINQSYAQYYNFRHKRQGHLFQDRFRSEIVDNEDYLYTLSAYIHNNPADIEEYRTCPERFRYSTLGVYLGIGPNQYDIVNEDFVKGLFRGDMEKAREEYYKFVLECNDVDKKAHYEFKNEKSEYRSGKIPLVRDASPEDIINFIVKYTNIDKKLLKWKYKREALEARALCIFLIRFFCDFTYVQISSIVGRLTLSRISELSNIGRALVEEDDRYKNIMEDFLKYKAE